MLFFIFAQVDYPEIAEGVVPRHRFMSAYEQKVGHFLYFFLLEKFQRFFFAVVDWFSCGQVEPPDRKWQYLLFAAEPYETIAFKVSFFNKISAVFRIRIH